MASKKYILSAALMLASATGAWAQLGGVHNYMDSSYIPASRMAQQNEWKNNSKAQNFPARPRDMWQVGVTGGFFMVDGDCPALPGWNIGVSVRKALGYVLSLRGSITYGQDKGLDYRKNPNLANNAVLNVYRSPSVSFPNATGTGSYIHNFKNTTINPSLDVLVSFNNIMFHSKESKLNLYGFVGYAPIIYKTAIDALKGASAYSYTAGNNGIVPNSPGFYSRPRKDIRSDLKNFFDGQYETNALLNDRRHNFGKAGLGNFNLRHSVNVGMGVEYKLSKRMSLSLEAKYVMVTDDYLDGWAFAGGDTDSRGDISAAKLSPDKDNLLYTNLGINFNVGKAAKRVAPLWWLNPLDYVYGEVNNPNHMLIPKQVLLDTDDDGVTDQFDIEPNTPAGCPVDSKGKSRDTDGDGVPDCRDKELITPTACQPVNADGVGKCPDPECCSKIRAIDPVTCSIGSLPSVAFKGSSVSISADAAAILAAAAAKIKANPNCKVCVVGHGTADKRAQQLSWDRANAVKTYLVEKLGISEDRFGFKYGEEGDSNTVDLMDCTGDDSPNTIPAPHPNLQKTK